MDYTEKALRCLNTYSGIVVRVTMEQVQLADGHISFREVAHHPGGVCILPLLKDGTVCCVRQFRYPAGEHLLELPAGKLEKDEDPTLAAHRELSEETGFTAGRMIPMGFEYTSPGYCTERIYFYLALDLTAGESHPDEGELLDTLRYPLAGLSEMAADGRLTDGKTALAVLRAERLLTSGKVKL